MKHQHYSSANQLELLRNPQTRLIAFDGIYRRYNKSLWMTAYKLLQDNHGAEDLVQSVFEKFLQLRTYDGIENIEAYLRQMCKTMCVNLYRKGPTKSFVSTDYIQERICEEDRFQKFSNLHEIFIYCKSLSVQQRRAFELVYLQGQDLKTAARIMDIAMPTVKMHVSHAKKFIRKTFFPPR